MTYKNNEIYYLGDLKVDLMAKTCHKKNGLVELAPLTFRLLEALIKANGALVDYQALKNHVWQGVEVSDDSLKQRIRTLRKALGDDSEKPRLIGVERHKGYKLLIKCRQPSLFQEHKKTILTALVLITLLMMSTSIFVKRFDKDQDLRLVVMPFETDNVLPEGKAFTRGLTFEIISRINSMPSLNAINLLSADAFVGQRVKKVAEEFDAAAIVHGSVSRLNESALKVNVQMIDGASEELIWSSVYEKTLGDIFDIQRDITYHIALVINENFDPSTAEHLKNHPTQNIEAYALFIQALGIEQQDPDEAKNLLQRVISLDQNFQPARQLLRRLSD